MKPYLIVLADDHILFRTGIKKIIEEVDGLQVVGEADDGLQLLQLLKNTQPNLVILDIAMPKMRGLEAAREIKRLYPRVKVLLLTMHKKLIFIKEGLEAGVDGFLVKEIADTELVEAIQTLKSGKRFFPPESPGNWRT